MTQPLLHQCRVCQREVAISAANCPHCGAQVPNAERLKIRQTWRAISYLLISAGAGYFTLRLDETSSRILFWGLAFISVLFGGAAIMYIYMAVKAKHEDDT
jgi:hypothetical protein